MVGAVMLNGNDIQSEKPSLGSSSLRTSFRSRQVNTHALRIFTRSLLGAEFQAAALPSTNPILIGHRWKEYHKALGLGAIPDFSWETVGKEKPDMIHVLDL